MLQLYIKRAKIFMLNDDNAGEKRFVANISAQGSTTAAPDWIKQTLTYQHGVKDGSIVNLTPVAAPAAKPEPILVAEEAAEEATEAVETESEDTADETVEAETANAQAETKRRGKTPRGLNRG